MADESLLHVTLSEFPQFEDVSGVHLEFYKGSFKLPLPGPSGIYSRYCASMFNRI